MHTGTSLVQNVLLTSTEDGHDRIRIMIYLVLFSMRMIMKINEVHHTDSGNIVIRIQRIYIIGPFASLEPLPVPLRKYFLCKRVCTHINSDNKAANFWSTNDNCGHAFCGRLRILR